MGARISRLSTIRCTPITCTTDGWRAVRVTTITRFATPWTATSTITISTLSSITYKIRLFGVKIYSFISIWGC
jgi:hypothetical protein